MTSCCCSSSDNDGLRRNSRNSRFSNSYAGYLSRYCRNCVRCIYFIRNDCLDSRSKICFTIYCSDINYFFNSSFFTNCICSRIYKWFVSINTFNSLISILRFFLYFSFFDNLFNINILKILFFQRIDLKFVRQKSDFNLFFWLQGLCHHSVSLSSIKV